MAQDACVVLQRRKFLSKRVSNLMLLALHLIIFTDTLKAYCLSKVTNKDKERRGKKYDRLCG